jgi:hypothetical protein
MSGFKKTNRKYMEQWVVPKGDQNFADGNLVDATTALGIADGQLGLLSWDLDGLVPLGAFLAAGDVPSDAKSVKLLQGTPASANIHMADNIWEIGDRDRVESGIITSGKVRSVASSTYTVGNYSVAAFGNFSGIDDEVEHSLVIRMLSHRRDRDYGNNDDVITVVAPAASVAPTDNDHYLITTLVAKTNERSLYTPLGVSGVNKGTKPIIAFGIKRGGGSGTVIGTLVAGDSIDYMLDNGNTISYVATAPFIVALAKLINEGAITAVDTIEVIDVTTAYSGSGLTDFIVVGFDERQAAYFDDIAFVRVNLEASLGKGFEGPTVTYARGSVAPIEENNMGRNLLIAFRNRAGLNVHTMQNHPHRDWFSRGKEYLVEGNLYNLNIVEYTEVEDTLTIESVTQAKLYIPTQVTIDTTDDVSDVVANIAADAPPFDVTSSVPDAVTDLNGIFGAWLAPQVGIEYKGDSTAVTPFI